MRIAITGGFGFIGTQLALAFLQDPANKLLLIDPNPRFASFADARFKYRIGQLLTVRARVQEPEATAAIDAFGPDLIYHLGGQSNMSAPEASLFAESLGIGPLVVTAGNAQAPLIMLSTGMVYTTGAEPMDEDGEISPVTGFAASKMMMESEAVHEAEIYGVDHERPATANLIVLRSPSVFGWGERLKPQPSFAFQCIAHVLCGREPLLYAHEHPKAHVRGFISVARLVEHLVQDAPSLGAGTYNIPCQDEVDLVWLITKAGEKSGKAVVPKMREMPASMKELMPATFMLRSKTIQPRGDVKAELLEYIDQLLAAQKRGVQLLPPVDGQVPQRPALPAGRPETSKLVDAAGLPLPKRR